MWGRQRAGEKGGKEETREGEWKDIGREEIRKIERRMKPKTEEVRDTHQERTSSKR